jgi:hypothetical protein
LVFVKCNYRTITKPHGIAGPRGKISRQDVTDSGHGTSKHKASFLKAVENLTLPDCLLTIGNDGPIFIGRVKMASGLAGLLPKLKTEGL